MTGCLPGCCKVDRLAKLMSAVTCVIAILHESKVNKTTQSDVHLFKDTGHMFTFCFIAAFNKYEQKISKFVPSISSHRNVFMFSCFLFMFLLWETRHVYNGPYVVKSIAAILSVYQYFLDKKCSGRKNVWVKVFDQKKYVGRTIKINKIW